MTRHFFDANLYLLTNLYNSVDLPENLRIKKLLKKIEIIIYIGPQIILIDPFYSIFFLC